MYDIVRIDDDAKTDEKEDIGARGKFWLEYASGERWMFKYPRENTGEHWSEKVAYEIAKFLGIECAVVELAEYYGEGETAARGTITKSFLFGGEDLVLGSELLSDTLDQYDKDKTYKQAQHSVDNVLSVFDKKEIQDKNAAKRQFIQYLLLDTIIGNTDRHHLNWGFLYDKDRKIFRLAPTYDQAASLGRELVDEHREEILSGAAGVAKYANHKKARGGIYLAETDKNAARNIDLVKEFCARCGVEGIGDIIPKEKLEDLAGGEIAKIISEVPDDWMSDTARRFAEEVVRYNIREKIFRD